jgi:hypothetical protein
MKTRAFNRDKPKNCYAKHLMQQQTTKNTSKPAISNSGESLLRKQVGIELTHQRKVTI